MLRGFRSRLRRVRRVVQSDADDRSGPGDRRGDPQAGDVDERQFAGGEGGAGPVEAPVPERAVDVRGHRPQVVVGALVLGDGYFATGLADAHQSHGISWSVRGRAG
jgi:hypothetical protein